MVVTTLFRFPNKGVAFWHVWSYDMYCNRFIINFQHECPYVFWFNHLSRSRLKVWKGLTRSVCVATLQVSSARGSWLSAIRSICACSTRTSRSRSSNCPCNVSIILVTRGPKSNLGESLTICIATNISNRVDTCKYLGLWVINWRITDTWYKQYFCTKVFCQQK